MSVKPSNPGAAGKTVLSVPTISCLWPDWPPGRVSGIQCPPGAGESELEKREVGRGLQSGSLESGRRVTTGDKSLR